LTERRYSTFHAIVLATIAAAILALTSTSATAQSAPADPSVGRHVEFLPRTAFRMGAEHISSDDPRLVWEANFGGDVDFVDYGFGRATVAANYQVMLGEQLRKFDPNQGNYLLEGSTSGRVAGVEVALVFHHISRHLSDRPKLLAVDWNMLGARVQKSATLGITQMDARVDVRRAVLHSFVDYTWEVDGGLRNRYRLTPAIAAISDVDLRFQGTDGTRNRGTQTGARGEGGLRFEGRGGAIELFVAAERRIDPFPTEFGVDTWVSAGFRLMSR
jgi:hypothetical protein